MERLDGETIGRRIVRKDELAAARERAARADGGGAREDPRDPARAAAVPRRGAASSGMVDELDEVDEPHPAIELGLWWLRENRPPAREPVVVARRLPDRQPRRRRGRPRRRARLGVRAPRRPGARPRVRARARVAVRRAGEAARRRRRRRAVPRALQRADRLRRAAEELDYWELAGNVGWAIGCLTQTQRHLTGQDRSVELATLGRLGAEVEYEICHLLERAAA